MAKREGVNYLIGEGYKKGSKAVSKITSSLPSTQSFSLTYLISVIVYLITLFVKLFVFIIVISTFLYLVSPPMYMSSPTLLAYDTVLNENEDGVYVVAADWCGHCKSLKSSGELEKLNSDVDVILVPHDHPDASGFMERNQCKGYPAIIMSKQSKFSTYEGERTATAMKNYYENI